MQCSTARTQYSTLRRNCMRVLSCESNTLSFKSSLRYKLHSEEFGSVQANDELHGLATEAREIAPAIKPCDRRVEKIAVDVNAIVDRVTGDRFPACVEQTNLRVADRSCVDVEFEMISIKAQLLRG